VPEADSLSKPIYVLVANQGADEGLQRAITLAERSLGELSNAAPDLKVSSDA
jgi:hypothetical protein